GARGAACIHAREHVEVAVYRRLRVRHLADHFPQVLVWRVVDERAGFELILARVECDHAVTLFYSRRVGAGVSSAGSGPRSQCDTPFGAFPPLRVSRSRYRKVVPYAILS